MTTQELKEHSNLSTSSLYEYKRQGIFRLIHIVMITLLNVLPKKIAQKLFLFWSSRGNDPRVVSENMGTWLALEVMYTLKKRQALGQVGWIDTFWQELLDNTRSIRNRLLMVKEELTALILAESLHGTPVHILSIGSGSARPVLEAIALLQETPKTRLLLVDTDETALMFSERLAQELKINHTQHKTGNFLRVARDCTSFKPRIVEMVGLLDYLTNRQCIYILREVRKTLVPGGYLITGNISPNLEAPFVTKGINWPMIYRAPEELRELLVWAGFGAQHIRIIQEPLEIHTLAIAQIH